MASEQWVFSDVVKDGQRGTVTVIRKPRTGLQFNHEANAVAAVTYYDATWRGDAGGMERFTLSPESLDTMRHPPVKAEA